MDLDKEFVSYAVLLGHLDAEQGKQMLLATDSGRVGAIARHLVRSDRLSRDQVLEIYRHVGYIPCPRCSHTVTLADDSVLKCSACDRKFRLPANKSVDYVGKVLGDYVITAKIGQGGMGDLYSVVHQGLDKKFALKVIAPECVRNASFLERFRREARIAAKVDHPNTIGIITVGQEEGLHYIVMPLVDGKDLAHHVEANGAFEPAKALKVMIQTARGLQAIHEAGILHRDIKPDNVLVDRSGKVLLGDFGLAREAAGASLTQTGVILGTPQYMSPEQCDGVEVDQRSDIYNLGVTWYYLLHGRPPFDDESPMAVMLKQKTKPLPISASVARDCGKPMVRVLARMTAKEPSERYPDVETLLEDLWALQEGKRPGKQLAIERRVRGWRVWPWASAIALIVGLTIGLSQHPAWRTPDRPTIKPPPVAVKAERESFESFVLRQFHGEAEVVDAKRRRIRITINRWDVAGLEQVANWTRTKAEMTESPEKLGFTSVLPDSEVVLMLKADFVGPLRVEALVRFQSKRPGALLGFRLYHQVVRGADRSVFLGIQRGASALTLNYKNSWPGTQGPVQEQGPELTLNSAAFLLTVRAGEGAYRIDLGQGVTAPTVTVGGPRKKLSGRVGLVARNFTLLELSRLVCEGDLDAAWVNSRLK